MLSNDYPPSAYPQLELQLPWVVNRELSNEDLVSTYGENPFQNSMQNYDFRPKKGSILIDGGKLVPGINDGQNIEMNHASHYSGQNNFILGMLQILVLMNMETRFIGSQDIDMIHQAPQYLAMNQ